MHDAQLEQDLSTLLAGRADRVPRSSVRRYPTPTDSTAVEQAATDPATMATSPTEAGPTPPRPALLVAREQTHGSFADNARVSQAIKDILRAEPGWGLLTSVEREAMDMIALKFSRILSGKSLELQHWEDVRGYAALAEEQCKPAT